MRVIAIVMFILSLFTGCGTPAFFPTEFQRSVEAIAAHTLEQGELQEYLASAHAQGINPSIITEVSITYGGKVGLEGLSGQVGIDAQGEGSGGGPSEAMKAWLREKFPNDPDAVQRILDFIEAFGTGPDES